MNGLSKERIRYVALQSACGTCAFCLRHRSQTSPFFELQAAHVCSHAFGGPFTFWNLLPLCPECNTSKRETVGNGARVPYDRVINAFYFWSFRSPRHDIALKAVLYKIYEIVVLDDCDPRSRAQLDRLLFHVVWTCRFFRYIRCIALCNCMRNMLVRHGGPPNPYNTLVERITAEFDSGHFDLGTDLLRYSLDDELARQASRSLSWRLAMNPRADDELLARLRGEDSFVAAGDALESSLFAPERKFDSELRERTSDLIRGVCREDRHAAMLLLDRLAEDPARIQAGYGCGPPYQRLHAVLCATKHVLAKHPDYEALHYWTRHHGSSCQVSGFFLPFAIGGPAPLPTLTSGSSISSIDLAQVFCPVPGSFAHTISAIPGLVCENDLFAILSHISSRLREAVDSG